MFSSKGLFKDVPCPKQEDCTLPACIFAHDSVQANQDQSEIREYDPFAAGVPSPPPAKKRKLDHEATLVKRPVEYARPKSESGFVTGSNQMAQPATPKPGISTSSGPLKASTKPQSASTTTVPASVERPVSPPPSKEKPLATTAKPAAPPKAENLIPRSVPKPPEQLKKRLVILQSFHQQLVTQNKKVAAADPKWKVFILSDAELSKFALDEEENAARKYESEIYRNQISQQVFKIKKLSEEDWRAFVIQKIRKPVGDDQKTPQATTMPPKPSTGLDTPEEELAVLRSLRTSLVGLEEHGYVTKQPSALEIASAKAGVEASAGWEKCDRCETRFQVFPGRDSQGRLTTGGTCRYHLGRGARPPPQKTDRSNGRASVAFSCCNKEAGSEGCTEAETHVFKVADKKRLASILQFEYTPVNAMGPKIPVSFDCEMGYTTLGMEVIRLTAVSWPAGEKLLDVLVRPYGEVLDLNTQYSGVSKKQFVEAAPYEAEANGDAAASQSLRKVESPAAARKLLFDILTPDTPLIGHAIENDLNVVRIIHPTVVDTVLLYPHAKGLPMRLGLKALASQHLSRQIQVGGAAGHDSKEDAIATGDLVTVALAGKWKRMKRDGWTFENGILVAPQTVKKVPTSTKAAL